MSFGSDGNIELSLEADGSIDHAAVLQQMYVTEFGRAGMLAWLSMYDIYSLENRDVPDALAVLCGADRLARETCVDIPVIQDLRVKMLGREPPFHHVGEDVEIGVPSQEDQPPGGRANACYGGRFFGREIQLSNQSNGNSVEVIADAGTYTCTGEVRTPDLQLNFEDADELLGGAPLNEYEPARAVILR